MSRFIALIIPLQEAITRSRYTADLNLLTTELIAWQILYLISALTTGLLFFPRIAGFNWSHSVYQAGNSVFFIARWSLSRFSLSLSEIKDQSGERYMYPSWTESGISMALTEPPCAEVVAAAERANLQAGHENDGFLSYRAGFLPLHRPLTAFPPTHAAWDELIKRIPELVSTQEIQKAVRELPVLLADTQSLPDVYLYRAACFLSIVSHAFVRLDVATPLEVIDTSGRSVGHRLPASLESPWIEVSRRLGRPGAVMTITDLIVYNWQYKIELTESEEDRGNAYLQSEKLKLLVPTVDNQEENVFYLTQLELLSRASPLIRHIVEAQRAALNGDCISLAEILSSIRSIVRCIGRDTLTKVSPRPGSRSYTDPVVWTKSVASLAIPLRPDITGPTGTSSPFFHMMDEFIGRSNYSSRLGKESQKLRDGFPLHWQLFLRAVSQISVRDFITKSGNNKLIQLWSILTEEYIGQKGILGIHRRKVYAYLSTSFRIGRSKTIGGFRGQPSDEPWIKVHRELENARQERAYRDEARVDCQRNDTAAESTDLIHKASSLRQIPVSEVLGHSTEATSYWFSAHGRVYDASTYCNSHPGGSNIIALSAGRDVSFDLDAVQHFSDAGIRAKLEQFVIGNLDLCQFARDTLLQELYDFTVAFGYKAADCQNTWALDMTFLQHKLTRSDPEAEMTAQKHHLFQKACDSLRTIYIPSLTSHFEVVLGAYLKIQRCSNQSVESTATSLDLVAKISATHDASPPTPISVGASIRTPEMDEAVLLAHAISDNFECVRQLIGDCLYSLESNRASKLGRDEFLKLSNSFDQLFKLLLDLDRPILEFVPRGARCTQN